MVYSKEQLIDIIKKLSCEGDEIRETLQYNVHGADYISSSEFDAWRNKILVFLNGIDYAPAEIVLTISTTGNMRVSNIDRIQSQLMAFVDLLEKDYIEIDSEKKDSDYSDVERIFNRFHKIARQLRTRHSNRETIKVTDEYDVQDIIHSLLLLYFDDIRTEEWTPSYAGGCVRMDFLIKDIQTVIEVKKARASMSPKDLGEELIIDIDKYQSHPDCKHLYCFVYDPEGLLGNAVGIKADL